MSVYLGRVVLELCSDHDEGLEQITGPWIKVDAPHSDMVVEYVSATTNWMLLECQQGCDMSEFCLPSDPILNEKTEEFERSYGKSFLNETNIEVIPFDPSVDHLTLTENEWERIDNQIKNQRWYESRFC